MSGVVLGSRYNVDYKKRNVGVYSSTSTSCNVERKGRRENIFAECKVSCSRKRVRNTWSSEQAGRIGMVTIDVRSHATHGHVVCKTRNMF